MSRSAAHPKRDPHTRRSSSTALLSSRWCIAPRCTPRPHRTPCRNSRSGSAQIPRPRTPRRSRGAPTDMHTRPARTPRRSSMRPRTLRSASRPTGCSRNCPRSTCTPHRTPEHTPQHLTTRRRPPESSPPQPWTDRRTRTPPRQRPTGASVRKPTSPSALGSWAIHHSYSTPRDVSTQGRPVVIGSVSANRMTERRAAIATAHSAVRNSAAVTATRAPPPAIASSP